MDKHLLHRSHEFEWFERTEPKHMDAPTLYSKHQVCNSCFRLQLEVEKLLDLEIEFANKLGVPIDYIKRYNNFSIVDLKGKYANVPKSSKVNAFKDNKNIPKIAEGKLLRKKKTPGICLDSGLKNFPPPPAEFYAHCCILVSDTG